MKQKSPKSTITGIGAILLLVAAMSGCAQTSELTTKPNMVGEESAIEQAMFRAAEEAEQKNNFESAVGHYARLQRLKPDDMDIALLLSRNLRYSGNAAKAADILSGLLQAHPDNPVIELEYAKALIASGKSSDALSVLGKLTNTDSGNWQAYSALGIAYDSLGKYKMAEESFSSAMIASPNNPVIMNNMAMSLAQAGRIGEAISTLEKAAILNRNSPHIRQNLALLYGINGDQEKAKSLAAMDLDPKEVETNTSFFRRFEGAN